MLLTEALDTALAFERKIRNLYAGCAHKTQDPKGQRLFSVLAKEEQGHVEHLEGLLQALQETGTVPETRLVSILPTPAWVEAEARKLAQEAVGAATAGDTFKVELDLLKEALDVERRASAMYADLVAGLDPVHRPIFARFLEIETGHVGIVQAEIDALAGHGHWFDFMEFSLEQ
jgi:rubrerythrin